MIIIRRLFEIKSRKPPPTKPQRSYGKAFEYSCYSKDHSLLRSLMTFELLVSSVHYYPLILSRANAGLFAHVPQFRGNQKRRNRSMWLFLGHGVTPFRSFYGSFSLVRFPLNLILDEMQRDLPCSRSKKNILQDDYRVDNLNDNVNSFRAGHTKPNGTSISPRLWPGGEQTKEHHRRRWQSTEMLAYEPP